MKARILWVVFLAASLSAPPPALAARQKAARTFSIDLGYIPPLATAQSMHQLWKEWEGVGTAAFDAVSEGSFMGKSLPTRILWTGAMYLGWRYANYTLFVANHEMGHGARGTAIGGSPAFSWNGGGGHASIFTFIGEGLFRYGSGASTSVGGSGNSPSDWSVTISAGGMNNSTMFAEALQDELYYYGGHVNQIGAYYQAKTDAFFYATNSASAANSDVAALINYWNGRGYGISTGDIRTGSLIGLAGSFSTLAYLWGIIKYSGTGDPNVNGFAVGPVLLPDLSFFQNPNGLSYRARMALKTGTGSWIPFSLEYLYKGAMAVEAGVGYRRENSAGKGGRKGAFQVDGFAGTTGGFGARLRNDFGFGSSGLISITLGVFHLASLEAQRSIGRVLSPALGVDATTRMTWVF